jgi:hypothetical protein
MTYDMAENVISDDIHLGQPSDDIHMDQPSDFTATRSSSDNASVDMHHHFIETHPLINGNCFFGVYL